MYYLGVDAGGTKTSFVLYSDQGQRMGEAVLPSCHFMRVGYDKMARILHEGCSALLEQHSVSTSETVISFGLAGYGRDEDIRKKIREVLATEFQQMEYYVFNDVETALAGAFLGEDGSMVIAGTGSIAFRKHQLKTIRTGGFGYVIGDEGSAYWMAKQMLSAVTKMEDGRLSRTPLYEFLLKKLALQNSYDLIGYVMNTLRNERDQIAGLAVYLFEAAEMGDPEALRIYREAAEELADLIRAAGKEDGKVQNVAYYGGVFRSGSHILTPLQELLGSEYSLSAPQNTPEYGAFLLAKNAISMANNA